MRYLKHLLLIALIWPGLAFGGWMQLPGPSCQNTSAGSCTGDYGETGTLTYAPASVTNRIIVSRIASCIGTTSSITARLNTINMDSREVILVIYADNGGEPGVLIWNSEPIFDAAIGSTTAAKTVAAVASIPGEFVWVGIAFEAGASGYERTAGTGRVDTLSSFATTSLPNPWTSTTSFAFTVAEYVTY